MELKIVNNHILVAVRTDIGLKTCVVDTGSPLTFFYDAVGEYVLDGIARVATQLNGIMMMAVPQQSDIEGLVGVKIDGFIGTDIMQKCGDVLINLRGKEIFFGETGTTMDHSETMRTIMGLPTFAVSFNGHETMAAFDSGAMYPFISTRLANEINLSAAHSRFSDFHPGYGSFEAELHAGSIAVAGVELGVCDISTAPYYDSILSLLGVSAFIGTNALRDSTILLSYSRNKIFISTTEN